VGEENWFLVLACIDPSALPESFRSKNHFWLERRLPGMVTYVKALGISLDSAASVLQSLIDAKGSTGCNRLGDLLEFRKRRPIKFGFVDSASRERIIDLMRQKFGKSFSLGDFYSNERLLKRMGLGSSGDDRRRGRAATVSLDRSEWIRDENQSDN